MPLGIYISVPFCRSKCSYCNFASDVFSRAVFERYVDRVCADLKRAPAVAGEMGGQFQRAVDSIYLGGGTPTLLEGAQLERIFAALRQEFDVAPSAEVTVECAPGTLSSAVIESLLRCGVNRVSLGVQSFVDREAAAVGRLHQRTVILDDLARLRAAGIANINIDLIGGLPHQTAESWEFSLAESIAAGVPHVSVYMLEVDEDSRLGSELLAGGARYHAHHVPDEDAMADFYLAAMERLRAAGIERYEISNFARSGFESRHNLKYWTRQPYLGFGVDAHSMLLADRKGHDRDIDAVRFATPDALERYMAGANLQRTLVPKQEALEESFFLGLRLTLGVSLVEVAAEFGAEAAEFARAIATELIEDGLLEAREDRIRLTPRGCLLSNEVFVRFMLADKVTG
jgi:oxygen-independent coproporphyrinogen III oxidase